MGNYNSVGYKPVNKINMSDNDSRTTIQDIKDTMQVLSTEELNSMRNFTIGTNQLNSIDSLKSSKIL